MADSRPHHRVIGFVAAITLFLADQVSKWLIMDVLRLPERGSIEIVPIFNLSWVENYGVSMGFLTASSDTGRWLLVALTSAIALAVVVWIWRERNRIDALALGFVLGGALGNITDRIRLGYVADFLDLHIGEWHPFLVFNIADAAISVGVLLLVLRALLTREKKHDAENANA